MHTLLSIGWFLLMMLSVYSVFATVGLHRMVQFFPEGKRWWMFPAQAASLTFYGAVMHYFPF
jgi:hypothetical protein